MKAKATFRIVLSVLMTCIVLLTGCWIDTPTPTPQPTDPPSNGGNSPPEPAAMPDLRISAVEVFPQHPISGQKFAMNIYVENIGDAKSGDYDLAIHIEDIGRGSTYPVGTFRNEGLHPGENVPAYSSSDRMVNDTGAYRVHVEIVPFLFEDGNAQNNVKDSFGFTVEQ